MKGISLLFVTAIIVIFAIGVSVFFIFFITRQLEIIHVFVEENKIERQTSNIANVILSSEYFVSERGIFEAKKLDEIAEFHSDLKNLQEVFKVLENPRTDLKIGYPNSIILFEIVDLEDCDPSCKGWVGAIQGPITIDAMDVKKLTECLYNNLDLLAIFEWYKFILPLPLPWNAIDIEKCVKLAFEEVSLISFPTFFPKEGFPVLIDYGDKMHAGRLFVGVLKWF